MSDAEDKLAATRLTDQQREELKLLMAEAQRRGVNLNQFGNKRQVWPTGYFPKTDGTLYKPNDNQAGFISDLSRYVLFVGGRGSGKSGAGAQKALAKIRQGFSGAVLNPDFENFKYSTWPEFKRWIPWHLVIPSHRYRQSEEFEPSKPFQLVFLNKAVVTCKGLRDPDSARGPNINWLWYDEAGRDTTGLSWQLAVAAVRVGKNPQAWATATPSGKDHWMYDFFYKKSSLAPDVLAAFEEAGQNPIALYRGSILDNRENLDPGFYASLLAAYPPGWLREQELSGEFVEQGGVLGNTRWFDGNYVDLPPLTDIKGVVRYWDLAASEKKIMRKGVESTFNDPDSTVGTKMMQDRAGIFYIADQVSGQWEWETLREKVYQTAVLDGPFVPIYVEQEPGSGGKNQVAALADYLKVRCQQESQPYFTVREHKPEGDKIMRSNVWFAEASQGKIKLVRGLWIDDFLKELGSFPIGRHDDRIDSVSGARLTLAPVRKWKSVAYMQV